MDLKDLEVEGISQKIEKSDTDHRCVSHLALDLGGSLIKLVYLSRKSDIVNDDHDDTLVQGRLHFAKFKYNQMDDCFDFISSKILHLGGSLNHKAPINDNINIKATGGGANKYSGVFKEKLGICLEQEDEMECLVAGANFLLKTTHQEAFTYVNGQKEFVTIDHDDLYPYVLVNVGTGVSITKVEYDGTCELIGGTVIGGGTFWGLGRLLTKCKSVDELVEMSQHGNSKAMDILVGDINGGIDCNLLGTDISSEIVASSFGKAMYDNKELEDYKPEDISGSLLRMISSNIGHITCMTALRFGLNRIFFSGSLIQNHTTMDAISDAFSFWKSSGSWAKGEPAKAMFLRHEGFVCAIGAFLKHKKIDSNGLVEILFDHQSIEM